MQAENADSAGLNRFPIWPATFARSACAVAGAGRIYLLSCMTARPSSPQEGASLTLAPIKKEKKFNYYTHNAHAHRQELYEYLAWVCCVALPCLFVCLTLFASFFLPSHLSFIYIRIRSWHR